MITLLTGAPGAGKTAHLVELLLGLVEEGRPLYVHGLNGLTIPHQPIDPMRWHDDLPDGAVFVIDEVQSVWRPRGPSQQPPAAVQALETHRHRGIDVFLTTQRPSLLDSNVRGLVGRHLHIRDTGWLGRWMYEWPECSESLAWKTCPIKRRYKLPAKAFDHYKSASLHTKPIRGRSPWALVAGGLVASVVVLAGLMWRSMGGTSTEAVSAPAAASAPLGQGLMVKRGPNGPQEPITAASLRASFQPRLTNAPETAPAYDELRQVVRMRRVVGGFCRDGVGCRCFDQDGLDPGLTQLQCFKWVKSPPFDPYRVPVAAQADDRERFGVGPRGGIGGVAPDAKPSSSLTRVSGGL